MDIEETLASRFQAYKGITNPMPSPIESAAPTKESGDQKRMTSMVTSSNTIGARLKELRGIILICAAVAAYIMYKRHMESKEQTQSNMQGNVDVPHVATLTPGAGNDDPLFVPIGDL